MTVEIVSANVESRSTVVGMQDSPGPEVGDDLPDSVSNLVDLPVKFLLPLEKLAACRLLDRRLCGVRSVE
jgi:hypothetical protein